MAVDLNQLAADDAEYAKQARMTPQQDAGAPKQPPTLNTIGTADRGHVSSSMLDGIVNEVEQWGTAAKRVGQDAAAGTATAVANIGDAVNPAHAMNAAVEGASGGAAPFTFDMPIWDHAKSAVMNFRDAVAVKDPNIVDGLAQGAAQLVGPFMAYSKALSGLHGFANTVAAGAATDATALQPHDMRTADLIALGRQTDTKIGAVLRTLGPYGLNAYVNFLSDRTNETEAEGRFKNALDGLGANLVVSPLIHAAGIVVKQGQTALRSLADNGVKSTGDFMRPPLEADPLDSLYREQARRDADAAANAPPGTKRPPLRQNYDPAESIVKDKARQDAELAAQRLMKGNAEASGAAGAPKGWGEIPGGSDSPTSSLEGDSAATGARTFLKAQTDAGHEGSLHSMVTTLGEHLDGSTEEGAFYKDILGRLSAKKLDTTIVPPDGVAHPTSDKVPLLASGHYSHVTDTMALYPTAFRDNKTLVHTVAHEAVHAATVRAIDETPAVKSALDGLIAETKTGSKSDIKPYGLTNAKEFVAEAESNLKFQQLLKSTKSADGRPLWDHYKEVIGGIFGLGGVAVTSPMFEKLLSKEEKKGA